MNFTAIPCSVQEHITSGSGLKREDAWALFNTGTITMSTLFVLLESIDAKLLHYTQAISLINSINWDDWRREAQFRTLYAH